ncbi:MAG: hypothetical protein ACT4NP_17790 [Pseudonocardiales bacterium]
MATNPIWITLITASLGGLLTLVGVMITQRQAHLREDARWYRECEREQTRWTREDAARSEERTQQRLADSYLEVLRIVEREGQWIEARITNLNIAAEEADLEPNPEARNWLPRRKLVKVPEPAVTDQATIAAHLAAFGPDNVRTLHQSWRSAIVKIRLELAVLQAIADNYQEGQEHPLHYLKDLREAGPGQSHARPAAAICVGSARSAGRLVRPSTATAEMGWPCRSAT